jgi:hypothetical protein
VQQLITAAKAPITAYNDKNWDAVKASDYPGFEYDEVATQRKAQARRRRPHVVEGLGHGLPDSKASFDHVYVTGGPGRARGHLAEPTRGR